MRVRLQQVTRVSSSSVAPEDSLMQPRQPQRGSDEGRSRIAPSCELRYSTRLVTRSLPVSMPAWTSGTSRSPPVTPTRAPRCVTTGHAPTWTAIPTTSWPRTCLQQPDQTASPRPKPGELPCIADNRAFGKRGFQDLLASRYPCGEPSCPSAGRPPQNTVAKS